MMANYDMVLVDDENVPAMDWLNDFLEPHWADVPAVFVGVPVAFAAGGYLGMFVYSTGYLMTRVVVMTPLARAVSRWALEGFNGFWEHRQMVDASFRSLPVRPSAPAGRRTRPAAVEPIMDMPDDDSVEATCGDDAFPFRGDGSELLPVGEFIGRQIVIYGPTGVGKSSVIDVLITHIHRALPAAKFLVFDPHYEPGRKPSWVTVAGKGRNYEEVAHVLDLTLEEMTRRYQLLAMGKGKLDPLYVIVDELSTLADEIPHAITNLLKLAREGRKVGVYTILTPHSPLVADMGMDGRGKSRQNYVFIGIPAKYMLAHYQHQPRLANVSIGPPNDAESLSLGKFVVNAPHVYVREPGFNVDTLFRFFCRQYAQRMGLKAATGHSVVETMVDGVVEGVVVTEPRAAAAWPRAFERLSESEKDLRQLAAYLVSQGFGIRKIGAFLPISDHEGREMARQALAEMQPGSRPPANTDAEKDLVLCLSRQYAAPAHRIARLLDGNDQLSLERVNRYLRSV